METTTTGPRRWIIGYLIAAIAIVIGGFIIGNNYNLLLPEPLSTQAMEFDSLFRFTMTIAGMIFLLVEGCLVFVVVAFRRKGSHDFSDAPLIEDNVPLEAVWTVAPIIIVTVLSIYSYTVLKDTQVPYEQVANWVYGPLPPGQLLSQPVGGEQETVEVIGQQFFWTFNYPKEGFTSTEMHVPVNKVILARITSKDVIHSFWVPQLRVKQDAEPLQWTEVRFTPVFTGTFDVICAELCGVGHYEMRSKMIVESQKNFDAWVASQKSPPAAAAGATPSAAAGKTTFDTICAPCHNLTAERKVGPGLAGIFNKPTLPNGKPVNDADLGDWIHTGGTGLAGYPPMPGFAQIQGQELSNLIAYLKDATKQ